MFAIVSMDLCYSVHEHVPYICTYMLFDILVELFTVWHLWESSKHKENGIVVQESEEENSTLMTPIIPISICLQMIQCCLKHPWPNSSNAYIYIKVHYDMANSTEKTTAISIWDFNGAWLDTYIILQREEKTKTATQANPCLKIAVQDKDLWAQLENPLCCHSDLSAKCDVIVEWQIMQPSQNDIMLPLTSWTKQSCNHWAQVKAL